MPNFLSTVWHRLFVNGKSDEKLPKYIYLFHPANGDMCICLPSGANWSMSLFILCPVFPDASVHGKGRQHRDEQRNLHFFAPEYACK